MRIEWNKIEQSAPEVIVLMPCGFDVERTFKEVHLLYKLPGWNGLPAVREGRVFAVNGHAYFSRPGPRLVDGLEILAQILHPEIFPWQAMPDVARKLS
ncbi:MAG: ABC transporter substrate-binding protein [Candidatus Binatia bacterium]